MTKTALDIIPGGTVGADLGDTTPPGGDSASNLPANEAPLTATTINWLNGSYAGADIKVVAHLYGKINKEEMMDSVKQQADFERRVASGARAFRMNVLGISRGSLRNYPDDLIETRFKGACNFPDDDAYRVLKSNLYNPFVGYVLGSPNERNPWDFADGMIIEWEDMAAGTEDSLQKMQQENMDSSSTCVLDNLQTLSVQSYREKNAVRSMGKSYVSGYVRGPRTIGGSMIFTMIREHPLKRLIKAMDNASLYGETQMDIMLSSLLSDQLPPVDLTIVFANEYGSLSKMGIYGVEFMTDGLTLSSEDIFTEVVCQFVARDIDVPTAVGLQKLSKVGGAGIYDPSGVKKLSASELAIGSKQSYNEFLGKIGMRSWLKGR